MGAWGAVKSQIGDKEGTSLRWRGHRSKGLTGLGFVIKPPETGLRMLILIDRQGGNPIIPCPSRRLATIVREPWEGWPSGQWQQTVNLPTNVYVGSNPTPSTKVPRSPVCRAAAHRKRS